MSNGQISVEQSQINVRCAEASAVQAERARVTSILSHPGAKASFDLALKCVAEGVHVIDARKALGPIAGDGSGLADADGQSVGALWAKAFGVTATAASAGHAPAAAKSEAAPSTAEDGERAIAASWDNAFRAAVVK